MTASPKTQNADAHMCVADNQVFAEFSSPVEAAEAYWNQDMTAIPTHQNSNATLVSWSKGINIDKTSTLELFGPNTNVQIVCGDRSDGFIDADLDDDIAASFAPSFFPPSAFVFGRVSRPRTHFGYRVDTSFSTITFSTPPEFEIRPFVELLGNGHLVRVPPSIHLKSSESIFFENGKAALPTSTTLQEVIRAAVCTSIAAFTARLWPKEAGSRHHLALAISGGLLNAGLMIHEVEKIISLATSFVGDEESEERVKVVMPTAENLIHGNMVTGWPTFADLLGEDGSQIIGTMQKWLAYLNPQLDTKSLAQVVISAKELLQSQIQAPPDIVTPWLKEGSVCLIYGPAKVCKTWFCLELSICIVEGKPFLDYQVNGNRRALYIDAEMMRAEIKERVEKLAGNTDRLDFLTADVFADTFNCPLDLTKSDSQDVISQLITQNGYDIVFVDTLSSLAPRKDENDNASLELLALLAFARHLKAQGVAVVLVHHSGHDGKHSRGASALPSAVDTVISLKKVGNDDELIEMEFTHTRQKKPEPSIIKFTIKDGGDVVTLDVVGGVKHCPEHALLPHLLKGNHQSQKELAKALSKSESSISGWVTKLRAEGLMATKGLVLSPEGKKHAKLMV